MALTRQVITSFNRDSSDLLGTKRLAIKIADESIVSGSLLTVESNQFCVLKSRAFGGLEGVVHAIGETLRQRQSILFTGAP
jgi:hypothetical protein